MLYQTFWVILNIRVWELHSLYVHIYILMQLFLKCFVVAVVVVVTYFWHIDRIVTITTTQFSSELQNWSLTITCNLVLYPDSTFFRGLSKSRRWIQAYRKFLWLQFDTELPNLIYLVEQIKMCSNSKVSLKDFLAIIPFSSRYNKPRIF